jgi:siroheme synthase-like protein
MKTTPPGLPVTLDLAGARVLVLGAATDEESQRKRELLQEAGAVLDEQPRFDPAALDGARLVVLFGRDPARAAEVFAASRARGVLCWCADDAAHSDFAMPAIARLGAARIAISTAGGSPALAQKLRATFEAALGDTFARFVDELAALRARTRATEPDFARRRQRLHEAIDQFRLELSAHYPDWFRR